MHAEYGMSNFRISVLVDNVVSSDRYLSEHGFSLLVENEIGDSILFDTGQSSAFLKNAARMNAALDGLRAVVLSHGHYDHANGLPALLKSREDRGFSDILPVYTGEAFCKPKWRIRPGDSPLFRGLAYDPAVLHGARFQEVAEIFQILPEIYVIPAPLAPEPPNPAFVLMESKNDVPTPDSFREEVYLLLLSRAGMFIISGCSHNGIHRVIADAQRRFPDMHLAGVAGGFHFTGMEDDALLREKGRFEAYGFAWIGLCHCTGERFVELAPDAPFHPFRAGDILSVGDIVKKLLDKT